MIIKIQYFLIFIIVFLTISCVSNFSNKRIDAAWRDVEKEILVTSTCLDKISHYKISWSEAIDLLNKRNKNLQLAREYRDSILRDKKNQWKAWIPRPTILGNLNSSLSQLGNLSFSDLSASVIAPLSIPNPYSEVAQAFEKSLSYLQSVDNYELSYRREVTSLYRIFSQMERLENPIVVAHSTNPDSIQGALTALNMRDTDSEQIDNIQKQLVQILNLPGRKPIPISSSRPKIDYSNRLDEFVLGKNYGMVAMRLASYNIEAALLREKGVKFRNWPSLNINVSNPSLYDSRNTERDPADLSGMYLFGGLIKTYDIFGAEVDSLQSAKQNVEHVKINLRLQLDNDIRDWRRMRAQYGKLNIAKQLARERLYRLRNDNSGVPAAAQLKLLREALNSSLQTEQNKERLDLEIWTWDDSAWK